MVVVHPAAIHPLTPGSPAYALLKVSAIGSIFALRFALGRRQRGENEPEPGTEVEVTAAPPRPAHPVSERKKRRRRR